MRLARNPKASSAVGGFHTGNTSTCSADELAQSGREHLRDYCQVAGVRSDFFAAGAC